MPLGVLLALAAAGIVWLVQDTHSRVIPLPAGHRLHVAVTVGDIRVIGEPRQDVALEIIRRAPGPDGLARMPVRVETRDDVVAIDVTQADGGTDAAYRSDITLRVPHAAALAPITIMEGRLSLTGLRGTITADVRRGAIEARDVQGTVRLETGIGNVIADRMRLSPDGLLRLRAFNGDVRLTLAERPSNARIMALALNGHVESEIPLQTRDAWGPRWGEATLGAGEPVISLDVITGTIAIKSP